MKPTKILLKEIEYGKNLFADNEPVLKEPHKVPTWFKDSILSLAGGEDKLERNTEDENLLLTALRKFTGPEGIYASDRGEVGAPQELIDSANTLLSLKSKFPKILDPTVSNLQPRSIGSTPMAFRGATLPYSTFDKLDWDKYEDLSDLIYVKNDPGIEVSPRSGKNIHSFTTALNIALNFSIRAKDDMSTRVPIIIAIPLDDPRLLFSPTFTDLVNDFGEKEVLFVGNTFKPAYFLLEDDVAYRLKVGPYKELKQQDISMLDDGVDNLLELKYGDNLLADKEPKSSPPPSSYFSSNLSNFVGGDNALEDNTEDENKLISALVYFTKGSALNNADLARDAKKLLTLKSKFPKILDPTLAKSTFSIGSSEMAFRGATIPLSTFEKLDWSNYTTPLGGDSTYALKNPGLKVSPRSGRGFHSFTSFINVALDFMDEIINSDYDESRVPVIICIPLNDPQLVFNPDFINIVSRVKEYETLFVGDTFEPEYFLVDNSVASKFKVGPYSPKS